MPTDYAPRQKRPPPKGGIGKQVLALRSFGAGALCGIASTLALVYLPTLWSNDEAPADDAVEEALAAAPSLTYEFMDRLPNEEVATNVTPYEPPAKEAATEQDDAIPKPAVSTTETQGGGGRREDAAPSKPTEPSAWEREGPAPRMKEPSAWEREGPAPRMKEPSAWEREGPAPRMKEPSAWEREGPAPRMKEPSAWEREGPAPRMKEPSAGEREGPAPRMKEPPLAASKTPPRQEYLLRTPPFDSRDEADALRARLILEGLSVAVKVVEGEGLEGASHRVVVGPFPNQLAMRQARSALRSDGIVTLSPEGARKGG